MLAVDPSSPFSGGALLGDRVRMQDHATDPDVYIRSMASRGHLGGLAWSTPQALRVLDAAGCDVVLVETVGVGQSEVEIAALADTTVVLLAPGMGDAIQAAKAGILEIGDVYVVNKADRDGADHRARAGTCWRSASAGSRATGARRSSRPSPSRGEGIDEVVAAPSTSTGLARGDRSSCASGGTAAPPTRSRRSRSPRLRERMGDLRRGRTLDDLADAAWSTGELDPYAAADRRLSPA